MKSLFQTAVNDTEMSRGYYDRMGECVVVPKNTFINTSELPYTPELTKVNSIYKFLEKEGTKKIRIHRTIALGDTLMVVPVVRYLEKKGFNVLVTTKREFLPILRALDIQALPYKKYVGSSNGSYSINLDGTVEQDHHRPKLQKLPRVYIYFNMLGVFTPPKFLDWSYNSKNFPVTNEKKPYIVFQGQGSTNAKSLSRGVIQKVLKLLSDQKYNVVYVGDKIPLRPPKNVRLLFKKCSILELFSLIERAECLITMDSAPLWISHFTKTPVVGIFGPTDGRNRLKLHPLYPHKVTAIQLSKRFSCPCCFEVAKRCNYNYRCLRELTGDELFGLIKFKLDVLKKG